MNWTKWVRIDQNKYELTKWVRITEEKFYEYKLTEKWVRELTKMRTNWLEYELTWERIDFVPVVTVCDWLCWGLTTRQSLRVILCRLPEKGRKEIEERVEEMKERDREERGTGMKVKKQKK